MHGRKNIEIQCVYDITHTVTKLSNIVSRYIILLHMTKWAWQKVRSQYMTLLPHQEIHQSSKNRQTTNKIRYKVNCTGDCYLLIATFCGVLKSETSVPTLQSNLIMEAPGSSKTSIYFHQTTWRHIIKLQPSSTMFLPRIPNLLSHSYGRILSASCLSVRTEQLGSHWADSHEI